jgi:hypothetical protein
VVNHGGGGELRRGGETRMESNTTEGRK